MHDFVGSSLITAVLPRMPRLPDSTWVNSNFLRRQRDAWVRVPRWFFIKQIILKFPRVVPIDCFIDVTADQYLFNPNRKETQRITGLGESQVQTVSMTKIEIFPSWQNRLNLLALRFVSVIFEDISENFTRSMASPVVARRKVLIELRKQFAY